MLYGIKKMISNKLYEIIKTAEYGIITSFRDKKGKVIVIKKKFSSCFIPVNNYSITQLTEMYNKDHSNLVTLPSFLHGKSEILSFSEMLKESAVFLQNTSINVSS